MSRRRRVRSKKIAPIKGFNVPLLRSLQAFLRGVLDVLLPSRSYLDDVFVGRRDDRRTLREFVKSEHPAFLVLTGSPGIGKTFLALKAIEDILKKREAYCVYCLARDIAQTPPKQLESPDSLMALATQVIAGSSLKRSQWNKVVLNRTGGIPFVIVIDGLNESAPLNRLPCHLKHFMKGIDLLGMSEKVKFIVTCRTDEYDSVSRSIEKYTLINTRPYPLGGLTLEERQKLVTKLQKYAKVPIEDWISFAPDDLAGSPLEITLQVSLKLAGRLPKENRRLELLRAQCNWIFEKTDEDANSRKELMAFLDDVWEQKRLHVKARPREGIPEISIDRLPWIGCRKDEKGRATEVFFYHSSVLEYVAAKHKLDRLQSESENREEFMARLEETLSALYSDRKSDGFHAFGEVGAFLMYELGKL